MNRAEVYKLIDQEREIQIAEWGKDNDQKNTDNDWVAYITKHAGLALKKPYNPSKFQYQMIRVAALAVAALESFD